MKDDQVYLQHIHDAIERIRGYTTGGRAAFLASRQVQDAVVRNLEIIGEAVKHLSTTLREQHPDIPWQRVAGMRDELIHEYFGVDSQLVWNVVEQHLPPLLNKVDHLLRT